MLGKIFTVCMLVVVSACLVRPEASRPKLAGVAGKVAEDVSLLLSKLGAKSTDEAIAKLWAKGDDLSRTDQENLVKLLKSSDGATALAALQRPLRAKLVKLDNMLAEYKTGLTVPEVFRQRRLADMDRTVAEVDVAATRYRKITHKITLEHKLPRIEYPASQILEMAKIKKIKDDLPSIKHLHLVGKPDEVVEASLLIRNFDNLAYFIRISLSSLRPDNLRFFKNVLTRGRLKEDVFPFYNALIKTGGSNGIAHTHDIARKIHQLNTSSSTELTRDLKSIRLYASDLLRGLRNRRMLLEHAGINKGHAVGIDKGSWNFVKGAGIDGSEMMAKVGLSKWARDNSFLLVAKMDGARKKIAFTQEMVEARLTIEKFLKEIEQM